MTGTHRTDLRIVAACVVALAVAMGIGRFAFTPLLPLMLRDGTLTVTGGAEWAAANYLGYLVGALTASRFSVDPRRGLRWALAGVAVATLAVAALGDGMPSWSGALLRGAAGVFSAWAMVCTSAWGLAELARRQASRMGAWIYVGVGLGIAAAGVLAWLGGGQPARWLWLEMGVLATVGGLFTWRSLRDAEVLRSGVAPVAVATPVAAGRPPASDAPPAPTAPTSAATGATSSSGSRGGHLPFLLCYGSFGFGYIVPATFLPAMARQQVSDPLVFGLTWPLFGLAAALSVVGAARWLSAWPRRRVWALAQGTMALGTALPLASGALWSLAASAVLVGGTFMVATMAGLQLARERLPANPTPLLARMTGAFAAGQIMGPLLVRALGTHRVAGWGALELAAAVATALLLVTAAWLWRDSSSTSTPGAKGEAASSTAPDTSGISSSPARSDSR